MEETMKDLQKEVGRILDRLAKIETLLEVRGDLSARLQALETEFAWHKGRAAVVTALIGITTGGLTTVAGGIILWLVKGT